MGRMYYSVLVRDLLIHCNWYKKMISDVSSNCIIMIIVYNIKPNATVGARTLKGASDTNLF